MVSNEYLSSRVQSLTDRRFLNVFGYYLHKEKLGKDFFHDLNGKMMDMLSEILEETMWDAIVSCRFYLGE